MPSVKTQIMEAGVKLANIFGLDTSVFRKRQSKSRLETNEVVPAEVSNTTMINQVSFHYIIYNS